MAIKKAKNTKNGNGATNDPNHISIQKEVVSNLIDSSSLTEDFYLMLILSSIIVSLGLILNNIVIVIGGMLVTPFLTPLLRLALAIVVSEKEIIKGSLVIILKSVGVILFSAVATALLVPKSSTDFSLLQRIAETNLYYFYVSLAAGVAAAYAWARPKLSSILPGVAISVTLLPPLVGIGVNLIFFHPDLIVGAFRSAVANILGILLASTFVFAILGFHKVKFHVKKEVAEEEKEKKEKEEAKNNGLI